MTPTDNTQRGMPAGSTRSATGRPRARARVWRAGLVVAALLGGGGLIAAFGGGSGTTGQPGAHRPSSVSLEHRALVYVNCMRAHGEPNMPDPISQGADHINIKINANSGIDPASRQFTAANDTCQRLLPRGRASPGRQTLTPAEQADYLNGVACMRSRGFPTFPDPVFQHNTVTFNAVGTRIDTGSAQYKRALRTCQKLIPAGLPDGRPDGS